MNPHEELEKYVKNIVTGFGSAFTYKCGVLGKKLDPPASSNNVWRWCMKSRVPNKRYHTSILEKTGIDFSQAVRQPKPGIRPCALSVGPVDFQDLLWVYAETPCVGCFIDGGSDECENAVRAITGLKCKSRNFVLKRKPTWEICTKQNTKVGDIVRSKIKKYEAEVMYVLLNKLDEMVIRYADTGTDSTQPMEGWEVEI